MTTRIAEYKVDTSCALFLDFDGTLAQIAERPDSARLDIATLVSLQRLHAALGGAIAIVTGRDIATIDDFLKPLRVPVAGVHGRTRRDSTGRIHAGAVRPDFAADIERALTPLLVRHSGLLIEHKHGAVALHYRAHPDLALTCIEALHVAAQSHRDVSFKHGQFVVEAVLGPHDKGTAVAAYLLEPPFAGRRPVFAGDDITDEDAFAVVNAAGGISIKIGQGNTIARFREPDTNAFLAWLHALAQQLDTPQSSSGL